MLRRIRIRGFVCVESKTERHAVVLYVSTWMVPRGSLGHSPTKEFMA